MANSNNRINNDNDSRYPFLAQYGKDVSAYNDPLNSSTNYSSSTTDWMIDDDPNIPRCRKWLLNFLYDSDTQKYTCDECARTIKKEDIDYEPDNINAKYILYCPFNQYQLQMKYTNLLG
jgi:hypothetical protein